MKDYQKELQERARKSNKPENKPQWFAIIIGILMGLLLVDAFVIKTNYASKAVDSVIISATKSYELTGTDCKQEKDGLACSQFVLKTKAGMKNSVAFNAEGPYSEALPLLSEFKCTIPDKSQNVKCYEKGSLRGIVNRVQLSILAENALIGPGPDGGTTYADTVGNSGVSLNTPTAKMAKVNGIGGKGIYKHPPKMVNGAEFIPAETSK